MKNTYNLLTSFQILVLLIIFTLSNCRAIDKTSISTSQTETNQRKLPLFPRINIKFIVNSRKISKKANVDQEITTKKPLMPKIVPKTKIEVNISDRVAVTRKPLMKLRNFTVKTITNRRLHESDDNHNSTKKNYGGNAYNSVLKDTSNNLRHTKKIQNFARTRHNRLPKVVAATTVNYFAEESKDRKEFIFLDSKNDDKVADYDLLQKDESGLETTTAKVEVNENLRPKRYVNKVNGKI